MADRKNASNPHEYSIVADVADKKPMGGSQSMSQQSERLKKALDALAGVCGPIHTTSREPSDFAEVGTVVGSSMANPDPSFWENDFHHWALERCVWREQSAGGIGALHVDFCRWAVENGSVPIERVGFQELLTKNFITPFAPDLRERGLIYGVILKEDAPRTSLEDPHP